MKSSRRLQRHWMRGALQLSVVVLATGSAWAAPKTDPIQQIEEMVVWGKSLDSSQAGYTNPTSVLTQDDILSINVATTEDLVKFEPSVVIRRRFIGDSNGVLGVRGSNMFQTSRTLVFADGVPLHYFLQSRWNGAPRWNLVSASEIAQVETIYGPYSAQYSGNAIGGVINIETAIPQKREFHFDTSAFAQSFDAYGFDETVNGYKSFLSYGDRFGNASVYFSYNHLENDSQPQSFFTGGAGSEDNATVATGALPGLDDRGRSRLFFGDTGIVDTTTDNIKAKLAYDFERVSVLLNVAFEDRNTQSDSPNSYVTSAAGEQLFSGNLLQDGQVFSIGSSRLNVSERDRESLSVGLRIRGDISDSVGLEANLSVFDILQDEDRSSARNPNDPAFTPAGEVARFDDTGWQTAEVKLNIRTGFEGLSLVSGVRYEAYELNFDLFDSENYAAGSRDRLTNSSGGETQLVGAFVQANWVLSDAWDLSLGGRFESFSSNSGYFANDDTATPELDLTRTPSTSEQQFSPKFSVGYRPNEVWQVRYSFGKAYRFPIVEELFSQFRAFNSISVANPELRPEDATAQNILLERSWDDGYVRVNLFRESVADVIESQSTILQGGVSIRTFVPIDLVRNQGVEFIVNKNGFLTDRLDVRLNVTYTDSEIVENQPDPSIEGNRYPRLPKWRSNLLATYHVNGRWDMGASLQFASDSFGRNDNTDRVDRVFGAQDGFTRLGLKSTWRVTQTFSVGLGVDNLTNQEAYVAHPWPGRTWFANIAYDL